jgi:hypothetical protein
MLFVYNHLVGVFIGMGLCVARLECVLGMRLCVARPEYILILSYMDSLLLWPII